jgi:hypothetical protein
MASVLDKIELLNTQNIQYRRPLQVKFSKREIFSREHKIPEIKFEDQRLTSYSGLIIFQTFFTKIGIKDGLKNCFRHLKVREIFEHHMIMMLLIVHLLLGYRRLRDMEYYKDDPLVKRLLGLKRLPDVSTVSRSLRCADEEGIRKTREYNRGRIINGLKRVLLYRITLDFDGSVLTTNSRKTEGTAVGYNKKKKGARSYYPLFCTIAQTGQVFDVYHRPGNVHDSKEAREFILECIAIIKRELPWAKIEVRMDSAFFSDEIVTTLDKQAIEYTISVPFERFAELKGMISGRLRWRQIDERWSYFESQWKPKKWDMNRRFIFIRQKAKVLYKEPIQLDMFIPHEYGYEFKVIITNKQIAAKKVLMYHHGRAAQEGIFGELKSQGQMDYIAVRRLYGNQMYMMAAIIAHNLNRELQMTVKPEDRGTTEKRAPLWKFQEIGTIRQRLLQRAGRLTEPQGKLTLTMSGNDAVKRDLLYFLDGLKKAA